VEKEEAFSSASLVIFSDMFDKVGELKLLLVLGASISRFNQMSC